jgi:HAD superfamily hydrolase (TIGR01509 family)
VLVVFDCDGVLVDSEPLANRELARLLTEAGLPTTTEQSMDTYMGRTWSEIEGMIERQLGAPVPPTFKDDYYARIFEVFASELEPVPGIHEALAQIPEPTCVASSGSHEKMERTLGKVGLYDRFAGRIFSAWDVPRGKPAPDLFLAAARALDTPASECVVIEDSPVGVQAARAADMRVLGYAGRTRPEALADADAVFMTMAELPALLGAPR